MYNNRCIYIRLSITQIHINSTGGAVHENEEYRTSVCSSQFSYLEIEI